MQPHIQIDTMPLESWPLTLRNDQYSRSNDLRLLMSTTSLQQLPCCSIAAAIVIFPFDIPIRDTGLWCNWILLFDSRSGAVVSALTSDWALLWDACTRTSHILAIFVVYISRLSWQLLLAFRLRYIFPFHRRRSGRGFCLSGAMSGRYSI